MCKTMQIHHTVVKKQGLTRLAQMMKIQPKNDQQMSQNPLNIGDKSAEKSRSGKGRPKMEKNR